MLPLFSVAALRQTLLQRDLQYNQATMTKRSPAIIEADHCDELPLRKRIKLQAEFDAKEFEERLLAAHHVTSAPSIKLLPEVACALAEISDDDTSVLYSELDSSKSLVRKKTVAPRKALDVLAPTRSAVIPGRTSNMNVSQNFCPGGRPLDLPPSLLSKDFPSKIALQEIDSTLLSR